MKYGMIFDILNTRIDINFHYFDNRRFELVEVYFTDFLKRLHKAERCNVHKIVETLIYFENSNYLEKNIVAYEFIKEIIEKENEVKLTCCPFGADLVEDIKKDSFFFSKNFKNIIAEYMKLKSESEEDYGLLCFISTRDKLYLSFDFAIKYSIPLCSIDHCPLDSYEILFSNLKERNFRQELKKYILKLLKNYKGKRLNGYLNNIIYLYPYVKKMEEYNETLL